MLGDFPLGAEPLGGFPGTFFGTESFGTGGGAAPFPVSPILHRVADYAMHKYTKRDWFERQFLADYIARKKAGLPVEEEFFDTPLAALLSQIEGTDK